MQTGEVHFGPFCLDLKARRLTLAGLPVKVGSRAFEVLCLLAAAKGEIVTKGELIDRVWTGAVVEENALQVHVSSLRKVLDQANDGRTYLITVPGRGYRLGGLKEDSRPEAYTGPSTHVDLGPSIAVMPFRDLSGDAGNEYFADGVVTDIITGLSRIKWLSVIARNSTFVFRDNRADEHQIASELGVRYLVKGDIRKSDERVRVTARLIEAATGASLWADKYDRTIEDVFALQDDIAMSVIGAIEPSLRQSEIVRVKQKRPESLQAYDLVLRALPHLYSAMPEGAAHAIPLLERALAIEPGYTRAHADLSWCLHHRFSRGEHRPEDRDAAIKHALRAVHGSPDDATALSIAAFVIALETHDTVAAIELFDRALAISSSDIFALGCSATTLAWMGKTDTAIERAERALRLSPFDPLSFRPCCALAMSYYQREQFELAEHAARRAITFNPSFSVAHLFLAAVLVSLERMEEARSVAQRALNLQPGFTIAGFAETVELSHNVFAEFAVAWKRVGLL